VVHIMASVRDLDKCSASRGNYSLLGMLPQEFEKLEAKRSIVMHRDQDTLAFKLIVGHSPLHQIYVNLPAWPQT